jgi:hypothetical protein
MRPFLALAIAAATEERCRFTIPVEVDSNRTVKYVVYEDGQDAMTVAVDFCASIGATNEVCHDAVGRAVMRRAMWQCDGRTHPHAPRSLVDHSTLGDVDYTPVKRFADIQRGIQHLHEHGYAVFRDAASPAQTRDIRKRLWDFFEERFHPLNRSKPETWDLLPVNEYGIMLLYGVGQSEAMWRVRELRRVRDVFAAAWEDEDLICDFGGVVAFRPHNCTDRWRTPERWYHVDMNVETYDGFESLQGFLALTDNTEASGGLVVLPGSHRHHADVSRRASTWWGVQNPDHQFLLLEPNDPILRNARPRFVACAEGDLVLWDSRVAHANTNSRVSAPSSGDAPPSDPNWFGDEDGVEASPSIRRERAKRRLSTLAGMGQFSIHKDCVPQLQRLVALVAMAPRARLSDEIFERRKRAFVNDQTTSHWPIRFDADAPRATPIRSASELSPIRRWLVGYRDDDEL